MVESWAVSAVIGLLFDWYIGGLRTRLQEILPEAQSLALTAL
jgi:hypothetical protein